MNAIDKIFSNKIGISFYWKKEALNSQKVQLVFRDIGFLLTLNELKDFSDHCAITLQYKCCDHCNNSQHCRTLLLRTPSEKIDLAVSKNELEHIVELIHATIFKIEMHQWINKSSFN